MIKKHFCGRHFCQEILQFLLILTVFLYKKNCNTQRLQDVNKSLKDYKGFLSLISLTKILFLVI